MPLTFATRPSKLARWQTDYIIRLLQVAWPDLECQVEVIDTIGDRILDKPLPAIGGKGIFTQELENALREGRVDVAVHSLKDLPTDELTDLIIGAIPERTDARDVWICPAEYTLHTIPAGARVGTSSTRRRAQLLARRPDIYIESIRGNVDTRLRKVREEQYDAIVLAAAGVTRLGLEDQITEYFPFEQMLPAPGQAALAVQCGVDDEATLELLSALDHIPTRFAVTAERTFLHNLGGGCSLPVGAYATMDGELLTLQGMVASPDGARFLYLHDHGTDAVALGVSLTEQARAQGADEILSSIQ